MTELEKLRNGDMYCFLDEDIRKLKDHAIEKCREYNQLEVLDTKRKTDLLHQLFGECGDSVSIQPNFNCDIGCNIHVGDNFLCNYNVTILDMAHVSIGDDCMIGPNTLISTVGHPISPIQRKKRMAITSPVRIGNNVWIGGNCTILPGVTIGNNSIVAAGAVVSKNVPENTIVAGVPAKQIRVIQEETVQ